MKLYYVYIVRCADGFYYVGITNDIERRLNEHNFSSNPMSFTSHRLPVCLVYSSEFKNVDEAIAWEKRLKRWSRAKKEALIQGNGDTIHALAACQNETNHKNVPCNIRKTPRLRSE